MIDTANRLALVLGQYQETWAGYVARIESRLTLLKTVKQGVELLVLVCCYLIFYFMDCLAQILALPLPLVR